MHAAAPPSRRPLLAELERIQRLMGTATQRRQCVKVPMRMKQRFQCHEGRLSVLDRDSDRNLSCGGGAIWLT